MSELIAIILGLFCAVIFVAHAVDAYLARPKGPGATLGR
jgi:hypothetical protein